MATNPLVAQGVLNRIRASVSFPNFPALNVTAPFLGREGIRMALEGDSTLYINTMTGAVTSPEPYMAVSVSVHLLKPQGLAGLYKIQMELSTLLGPMVVRPDTTILPPYDLYNSAIEGVAPMNFSGEDAGFVVALKAYYIINNILWDKNITLPGVA